MVVVHRLLILLAAVTEIGAILAKYWLPGLRQVSTPRGWLIFTSTLLFFAIALMLEQSVTSGREAGEQQAAPRIEDEGQAA